MSDKTIKATNARGDVVAEYPDFDPGDPVSVAPDRLGSNVRDAESGWVFAGPTRHPSTAVIRDSKHGSSVHVERERLSPRR